MAMPLGNMVVSDKMQFPSSGAGAGGIGGSSGGEIQHHHHQRQWFSDERDRYIIWLKSEFAAANAIIDLLCQHLRVVGEPREYDVVIRSVQQRRQNWNPVLHMQHYFPVEEVKYALHQVAGRRQQRYRRSGSGFKHGHRGETHVKEAHNSVPEYYGNNDISSGVAGEQWNDKRDGIKTGGDPRRSDDKVEAMAEEKREAVAKSPVDGGLKSSGCSEIATCGNSEHEKKQDVAPSPKTFVGNEIFEGKTVNVVEGLKLYEELLDEKEVSKLVSLANDLRAAGRKGQFQGQAYMVSKRPMRGHGREMIQLGLQIADSSLEDEQDCKMEPIPSLLQGVIESLVDKQVMTVKPDSCIIDFYNEGDHSHPNMWPSWFGRPISMLLLTECDITLGKFIGSDHPGDYRGSLKLSLAPGSLLVMQGQSTDLAKHAIPATHKPRIFVTFTKSQPRKFLPSERLPSSAATSIPHWGPQPSRSPSHIRHPVSQKHYAAVPTAGANRPLISSPNQMQPLFVAPAVPPFPPPFPIAAGLASPYLHVPGTGVFFPPPGSGNSSTTPTNGLDTKDNGSRESNHNISSSPKVIFEGNGQRQERNGAVNGSERGVKKEPQQDADNNVPDKRA